jgi:hypothetical protein
MALDKAIEHGKEKRRQYRGAASVSAGCRHGGDCGYCRNNRTYKNRKRMAAALSKQDE